MVLVCGIIISSSSINMVTVVEVELDVVVVVPGLVLSVL